MFEAPHPALQILSRRQNHDGQILIDLTHLIEGAFPILPGQVQVQDCQFWALISEDFYSGRPVCYDLYPMVICLEATLQKYPQSAVIFGYQQSHSAPSLLNASKLSLKAAGELAVTCGTPPRSREAGRNSIFWGPENAVEDQGGFVRMGIPELTW